MNRRNKIKVSVIIPTYNRPMKVISCLRSLLQNPVSGLEIIVVDQSNNNKIKNAISKLNSPLIREHKRKEKGESVSRNFGIKQAKGEIIALTDDDCIVDKYWLRHIVNIFEKNKDILGIFGSVLPYQQEKHRRKICPSTQMIEKDMFLNKPPLSYVIGQTNNCAFRRAVFKNLGGFTEQLGVASLGGSAEDVDFMLRLLSAGYQVMLTPKIKVYHG